MRKYLVFETFRSMVSPLSRKGIQGKGDVNMEGAVGKSFASSTILLSINHLLLAKREME